jgi:hypothetical protein
VSTSEFCSAQARGICFHGIFCRILVYFCTDAAAENAFFYIDSSLKAFKSVCWTGTGKVLKCLGNF